MEVHLLSDIKVSNESDVEQKLIYKLLTLSEPNGLGYSDADFATKVNIRKIPIGKGSSKKLYYPDYAIILSGVPFVIIEAKGPGEDLEIAMDEARLYATEINAKYPRKINPCQRLIVTDGSRIISGYWDQSEPYLALTKDEMNSVNSEFSKLIDFVSKRAVTQEISKILKTIRGKAKYFKPLYMLGGQTIINESVGENSFGSNVSIEYKYLFNPETLEEREAVVKNAYISSRRKMAHVAPIDKIIRAALPTHVVDASQISNTSKPDELVKSLGNRNLAHELCLLIGSVGSGKSTFTDHLKLVSLPEGLRSSTIWATLNLNEAPLSKELIYKWVVENVIRQLKLVYKEIDFDDIETIKNIFDEELKLYDKGLGALLQKGSESYNEKIYSRLEGLLDDTESLLTALIRFLCERHDRLLIIVLDNSDKRNSDEQLLMFEVATWVKKTFKCMVFLPIRDTTYDLYHSHPPLDTVIKDLVFRIDPPLLEKVIQARLNFALRQIGSQTEKFSYVLPNSMRVECGRNEVGTYLKAIVQTLFQDSFFRSLIKGLAGRNIRKGLEIVLDFCKSGHISADDIFRMRNSDGDFKLQPFLVSRILLKGNRKHYSDSESRIKNLFFSDNDDDLPDPFVRISMLSWLHSKRRDRGPNGARGFHQISSLINVMQSLGHEEERVLNELSVLIDANCIYSEGDKSNIEPQGLISIAPSGVTHLELLKHSTYLAIVAEDTNFRDNQRAKVIKDNMTGTGPFRANTRESELSSAAQLLEYMISYKQTHHLVAEEILQENELQEFDGLEPVLKKINQSLANNPQNQFHKIRESEYPDGASFNSQIVSIQEYGLIIELGVDATGFIHISELKGKGIDEYEEGEYIEVEIKRYNAKHKKFDLKLGVSD